MGCQSVAEYYSGGRRRRTKYLRYGNDQGLEPLVIIQEHHGIKPLQLPSSAKSSGSSTISGWTRRARS